MRKYWLLTTVVTGALLGVVVYAAAATDHSPGSHDDAVIVASPLEILPAESAPDWVTYSDHLVTVIASGEREVPPGEGESTGGGSIVGREVTFDVRETLWSREGSPELPAQLSWQWGGWQESDEGDRRPWLLEGAAPIEIGQSYVIPVVLIEWGAEPAAWAPLSVTAVIPVVDDVLQPATETPDSGTFAAESSGESPGSLAAILAETPIHPEAEEFMDVEAVDRYSSAQTGRLVDADGDGRS